MYSFKKIVIPKIAIPKIISVAALALALLLVSWGCITTTVTETSSEATTLESTSTSLEIPELLKTSCRETQAEKIISLSPTATEILYAIGAGGKVIAVDERSNHPVEAPNDLGLSGFNPNIEAILGLEPDLVVVSSPSADDAFAQLENLDICLVRQDAAVNLDGVYRQISALGVITGNSEMAQNLIQDMQNDIAEILERTSSRVPRSYFYELDTSYYSVTKNTFIGYALSLLNLHSISPDTGNAYPQLNQEAILTANPDIIFLADAKCCGQSPETVKAREGWDTLKAVRDGNIFVLDEDIASRWGPRIVNLLEDVADQLER